MLCRHVDHENNTRLAAIKAPQYSYEAADDCIPLSSESERRASLDRCFELLRTHQFWQHCMAAATVRLKRGAQVSQLRLVCVCARACLRLRCDAERWRQHNCLHQVMLVRNVAPPEFVNGSRGVVVDFVSSLEEGLGKGYIPLAPEAANEMEATTVELHHDGEIQRPTTTTPSAAQQASTAMPAAASASAGSSNSVRAQAPLSPAAPAGGGVATRASHAIGVRMNLQHDLP